MCHSVVTSLYEYPPTTWGLEMIREPSNFGAFELTDDELVRSFVFLFVPEIATDYEVESWFCQLPNYDPLALDVILKVHLDDEVVKAWRREFIGTLDFVLSTN